MLHFLNASIDDNGATTRVVLFDYKNAFDLIDHRLLMNKLATYDIPQWVLEWITDFLTPQETKSKVMSRLLFRVGVSTSWATTMN